jgi:hypothetical protein
LAVRSPRRLTSNLRPIECLKGFWKQHIEFNADASAALSKLEAGQAQSPKTGSLRGRLEAPGFRHGEESLPLKVGDALDGLEPANNLSE